MTASMTLGVRATSSVDQKIVDSKRTLKGQSMTNNQHTHIEVKTGRKLDLKLEKIEICCLNGQFDQIEQ